MRENGCEERLASRGYDCCSLDDDFQNPTIAGMDHLHNEKICELPIQLNTLRVTPSGTNIEGHQQTRAHICGRFGHVLVFRSGDIYRSALPCGFLFLFWRGVEHVLHGLEAKYILFFTYY